MTGRRSAGYATDCLLTVCEGCDGVWVDETRACCCHVVDHDAENLIPVVAWRCADGCCITWNEYDPPSEATGWTRVPVYMPKSALPEGYEP